MCGCVSTCLSGDVGEICRCTSGLCIKKRNSLVCISVWIWMLVCMCVNQQCEEWLWGASSEEG